VREGRKFFFSDRLCPASPSVSSRYLEFPAMPTKQWHRPKCVELPPELARQSKASLLAQDQAAGVCHGCGVKVTQGHTWCSVECHDEFAWPGDPAPPAPERYAALIIHLPALLFAYNRNAAFRHAAT
jgi:hypothetical protein